MGQMAHCDAAIRTVARLRIIEMLIFALDTVNENLNADGQPIIGDDTDGERRSGFNPVRYEEVLDALGLKQLVACRRT